jgi:hypothetical protein
MRHQAKAARKAGLGSAMAKMTLRQAAGIGTAGLAARFASPNNRLTTTFMLGMGSPLRRRRQS